MAVDDDGDILGSVTFCPPGLPVARARRRDGEGEFRMLAVAPDARGRGVGEALAGRARSVPRRDGATADGAVHAWPR